MFTGSIAKLDEQKGKMHHCTTVTKKKKLSVSKVAHLGFSAILQSGMEVMGCYVISRSGQGYSAPAEQK